MCFLHQTVLVSHGRLRSSTCLVDNRWVVKVSSYGLRCLRKNYDLLPNAENEYKFYRNKLWTAPELLRHREYLPYGTQKGDVYSFAIILQEVIFHASPFFATELSPKGKISAYRVYCIP